MNKSIEEAVNGVLKDSTGRFRYRLIVARINFFSEPLTKDRFILEYENILDHAELSAVQYEGKTEYTPGKYMWQTF
jgi:hypothetical protein